MEVSFQVGFEIEPLAFKNWNLAFSKPKYGDIMDS